MGASTMQSAPNSQPHWDDAVLAELRDLYEPLRRFAAVATRYDIDPDDVVQEAYTRFLSGDRSEIRDVGAYLRRSIINLAHNERRRERRATAATQRLGDTEATTDIYPSALVDLMDLDPRDRALLYLVDVEGFPTADAAATVGIAGPAARMALSRARKTLRKSIEMDAGR